MATVNIVGNIKTQDAATWAADATVYTDQQILITSDVQYAGTDQNKFKIADGVGTWSTLDYMADTATLTKEGVVELATQAEVDTGTDANRVVTPSTLAGSTLAGDVATNNAKVTNATHTGEVTGSGVLTVDKTTISNKTLVAAAAGDHVLISDATDSDNLKKVNVSDFLGGGGQTYTLIWQGNSLNPADSTRYWLATSQNTVPSSGTNGNKRNCIPVTASEFSMNIGLATNGSTEPVTWVLRNHTQATEANFAPTHALTASSQANAWSGTVTLACTSGDFIEVILSTPAWSSNPTGLRINAVLTFLAD